MFGLTVTSYYPKTCTSTCSFRFCRSANNDLRLCTKALLNNFLNNHLYTRYSVVGAMLAMLKRWRCL